MFKEIIDYFGYLKQKALDSIVIPYSEVNCATRFKDGASLDVEIIITLRILDDSDDLDKEQIEWYNSLPTKQRIVDYPKDKDRVRLVVENRIKKVLKNLSFERFFIFQFFFFLFL